MVDFVGGPRLDGNLPNGSRVIVPKGILLLMAEFLHQFIGSLSHYL